MGAESLWERRKLPVNVSEGKQASWCCEGAWPPDHVTGGADQRADRQASQSHLTPPPPPALRLFLLEVKPACLLCHVTTEQPIRAEAEV